jgi:hypothetical protein
MISTRSRQHGGLADAVQAEKGASPAGRLRGGRTHGVCGMWPAAIGHSVTDDTFGGA